MATLTLEHLDKTYSTGRQALVDVCLTVADGELLVLVGPSGCGKSTALRVIAGLETATGGHVRIDDRIVDRESPQARNVAMVFQDYALYPHLTARENLGFPLQMRRMPKDEIGRRVSAIARALEIEPWLDRLPKQLSGGERQRVAMGRALVREPSVSLLDEPLSNLDARLRVQVRAEIKSLQRRMRTTMVYVTHDQVEAMTLGDRVAVLERGRLQQVATPRELYAAPANAFVAGFIGNPPMNLFATTLEASADGLAIVLGGERLRLPPPLAGDEALRAALGASVIAGIRPEDVRVTEGEGLAATVEHVENLGHETLVHATLVAVNGSAPGLRLIARAPGMRDLVAGASARLALDSSRIHLFARDGGARIAHIALLTS